MFFSSVMNRGGCCSYGMAGGCFTDVVHSSKRYHQEHAIEPHRLPKDVMAAWGAVILRFQRVAICTSINLCFKLA